jgi:hypothetical protein
MQKSNYEVEVLVNGKPLKEYLHEGRMYVEGREGTTFSLRLRNSTGSRKLFVPSIDGLSVMNGEEARHDSSGYIVRPWSAVTVDGWRTSDESVAEFYFSRPDDSYRKRMERGNNLGVIGVAVFSEKEMPQPVVIKEYLPPHHHCHRSYCWGCKQFHCRCDGCNSNIYPVRFGLDMTTGQFAGFSANTVAMGDIGTVSLNAMNESHSMKAMSQQGIGTGWGDAKRSEVVSVEFERKGAADTLFEIYYNTREQLEAAGVNMKRGALEVAPQAFPGQYCKPPAKEASGKMCKGCTERGGVGMHTC